MFILRNILIPLQNQFSSSRKGAERGVWFIYTPPGCHHPLYFLSHL